MRVWVASSVIVFVGVALTSLIDHMLTHGIPGAFHAIAAMVAILPILTYALTCWANRRDQC